MEATTPIFRKTVFHKQVFEFHCSSIFLCQTSGRQNHWSLTCSEGHGEHSERPRARQMELRAAKQGNQRPAYQQHHSKYIQPQCNKKISNLNRQLHPAYYVLQSRYTIYPVISVADPDPGYGVFLIPRSRIRDG
jgi:hypothetical protein